jgi:hypothetical protein
MLVVLCEEKIQTNCEPEKLYLSPTRTLSLILITWSDTFAVTLCSLVERRALIGGYVRFEILFNAFQSGAELQPRPTDTRNYRIKNSFTIPERGTWGRGTEVELVHSPGLQYLSAASKLTNEIY